jgi:hypothetical protein
MRKRVEFKVGDQTIAKQPNSPAFAPFQLFPTGQGDEAGFSPAVKDRVPVPLGLSFENRFKTVFDETPAQQFDGVPAHAHRIGNFPVAPAPIGVKEGLRPFSLPGRMLPFIQNAFKLNNFTIRKRNTIAFP